MTLERQVSSLALSQRLKELGVKQESLFFHEEDGRISYSRERTQLDQHCSAFTVAELGEMMDAHSGKTNLLTRASLKGKWYCEIPPSHIEQKTHCEYADTEADCRAKMLIYLLENKLITL